MNRCNCCFVTNLEMVLAMPKDWPVFKLYICIYPLTLGILIVCDCLYSANLMRFISSTDSGNILVSAKHYALFESRVCVFVLFWFRDFFSLHWLFSSSTFDVCKGWSLVRSQFSLQGFQWSVLGFSFIKWLLFLFVSFLTQQSCYVAQTICLLPSLPSAGHYRCVPFHLPIVSSL